MSKEYEGQDPLVLAQQAERDLNSHAAKHGLSSSDTAMDSGIDSAATKKYPGAEIKVGPAASGREIGIDEGGDITATGRTTKDHDFEGPGGPETKRQLYKEANPGNDDVEGNVRQSNKPEGTTVPTNFGGQK